MKLRCQLAGVLGACVVALAPAGGWAATRVTRARGVNARTGRATPPFAELVKAARKNDRAALERLAGRFGVARLGEGARSADAAIAQAALETVPFARGGVLLAGVVADRLDAGDAPVAIAAARTLGALFEGDVPSVLAEWEVPADVVTRACGGLRALAARADAASSARLAALDALAVAQTTCTPLPDVAALLRDPAPEVRRAAALVLPAGDPRAVSALRAGLADPDPGVSAACAASVCRRVEPARGHAPGDALVAQATMTARALVAAPATRPEDAVEMLACVSAAGTASDRALLERLRGGAASPVRDRAAELLGVAAPGKTE
ncbi:MAG TPA: hypothetical protein VLA14_02900 [Polyangia bacterium]|nr:hypothetical protein [Polyangia bacterium]